MVDYFFPDEQDKRSSVRIPYLNNSHYYPDYMDGLSSAPLSSRNDPILRSGLLYFFLQFPLKKTQNAASIQGSTVLGRIYHLRTLKTGIIQIPGLFCQIGRASCRERV